jgi:glyoxylase-like metal-dependent hydrolase (beta-lactamase superfamily II)
MPGLRLERDVAPGIHRIEDAHTTWYLVEDDGQLSVIDTGLPRSWNSLHAALGQLGRSSGDISAVVLTHGHFDHMGFARRAQGELQVPVLAPQGEEQVVAHPWRYEHEHSRLPYLRHPAFARIFTEMTLMGALSVAGVTTPHSYAPGAPLDVPGRPHPVATPGHTYGHCSLLLADRGALIAGDAFVMLDPYTGREGPCIVAGAATADSERNLQSLDALAELDAATVLTGHGPVYRGSLRRAVEQAKTAGPA